MYLSSEMNYEQSEWMSRETFLLWPWRDQTLQRRYTFLSVEQSELDRNLAPSRMRLAAQHVMLPRAGWGLNGEVCNRIVILSVVHVLETFQDERRRERRTAER